MSQLARISVYIFISVLLSCAHTPVSQTRLSAISNPPPDDPIEINSVFVKEDTLSYGGFEVVKLTKNVKVEYTTGLTEVSYAVLKRNGKILAKFDGVYSGYGNATDFGLFSFVGGASKQLVVAQTIPRGGRYWVVDLSPEFRIIYDSGKFDVGREDLGVLDIDKDGKYEILQEVTAFYGFNEFGSAETPLPMMIFKYDDKSGQYLPANNLFQAYALRDADSDLNKLTEDENGYLSKRLGIVLDHILAGKEKEAWELFDRIYKRPDKAKIKSQVETILKNHPVYQFMYRKG